MRQNDNRWHVLRWSKRDILERLGFNIREKFANIHEICHLYFTKQINGNCNILFSKRFNFNPRNFTISCLQRMNPDSMRKYYKEQLELDTYTDVEILFVESPSSIYVRKVRPLW